MYTFWAFYTLNDINKSRNNKNYIKNDMIKFDFSNNFFNSIIKKINLFAFEKVLNIKDDKQD